MPYIPQHKRADLPYVGTAGLSEGELNYVLTTMLDSWLGYELHYDRLNAAIGVLECVKLELYRRVAVPYEDAKMAENGDVYQKRGKP